MKCGYCGKRFPTTQLDREMFRNEAWGTPYHYAKNEFGNDDYVSEAGFDPDDEENFLCPDCVDKIYKVQEEHAKESLERDEDGHVIIRLHSSKHLFSSLLLNAFTPWTDSALNYPGSAYLRVILSKGGKIRKYGTLSNSSMDLQIQFEYNNSIYTLSIKDSTSNWMCSKGSDIIKGVGSSEFSNKIF